MRNRVFRRVVFLVVPLSLAVGNCVAQASASFTTKTSSASRQVDQTIAIDVNNDGVPDLVSLTFDPGNQIAVNIAKGDGTFSPTVFYSLPNGAFSITSGDFNGDGKVDLMVSVGTTTSSELVLLAGNGNGTFQAAKIVATLPSGVETDAGLATADFNGDGRLDVIMEGYTYKGGRLATDTYYILEGNGSGGFTSPRAIYTVNSPSGENLSVGQATVGDFNGDGKADLALISFSETSVGSDMRSTLHVFYGDGAGNFTDTTPYTLSGTIALNAGDLNSDGRTDLFGLTDTGRLVTLYGQSSKTFALYTAISPTNFTYGLAMGDFNGDGKMDLVTIISGQNPTTTKIVLLLATGTPGVFTQQTYASIPQHIFNVGPVVGDFNRDGKPDILDYQYDRALPSLNYINITITVALNTTSTGNWGGCAYPTSEQGFHVCAPSSSSSSPVSFNAAANSFGQLRKLELWVDGKKLTEQHHTWGQRAYFSYSAALAAGAHKATFFASDIDNRLQRSVVNFTVGSGVCTAPSSPGVHICSPASGSTVSSPVKVQAASAITGTLARVELWVDGVKKYTETTSTTLTTSLSLGAGSHRFTVIAVNTAGTKWQGVSTATVR